MKKRTPIGFSDFKQIIADNRYYVDKTQMVRATCVPKTRNSWA